MDGVTSTSPRETGPPDDHAAPAASLLQGVIVALYLGLAVGVELVMLRVGPFDNLQAARAVQVAVLLDGILMAALLIHGAVDLATPRPEFGRLLMTLAMLPLARVVAQALSLGLTIPEMGLYLRFFSRLLVIALVLHAALYFLIGSTRVNPGAAGRGGVGGHPSRGLGLLLGALVLLLSPVFGMVAFRLLEPTIPDVPYDDPRIGVAVLAVIVTALWQEMFFRGLLLHAANRAFAWVGATALSGLAGAVLLVGTLPSVGAEAWAVVALGAGLSFLYAAQVQASRSLVVVVVSQVLLQATFFLAGPRLL